jgi:transposase InsO family protein
MKLHRNHRTCPNSRLLICRRVIEEGWSLKAAAEAAGCSERTAAKWLARFRAGDQVLEDRCSRPHSEWAYARVYGTSAERTAQLPRWLSHYNFRRPHGSLGHRPPATGLNDLVRNYN